MSAKQRGFGAFELMLVFVAVGIVGFAGWFVWNSQKQISKTFDDSSKGSSAAVSTKKSATTATDTSATNNSTTATQDTSAQQATNYVAIKEWGIKIQLIDAEKVTFSVNNTKDTYAGLFDFDGVAKPTFLPQYLQDKTCEPGVSLYRSKQSQSTYANKKIGDYYYVITGGPGACSENPSTNPDDQLKYRFLGDFTIDKIETL